MKTKSKKLICLLMFFVMLFCFDSIALCETYSMASLPFLKGDWLNSDNEIALQITDNSINGKQLIWIGSLIGSGTYGSGIFRVINEGQYVDYKLEWATTGNNPLLTLNDNVSLHRYSTTNYYESVGGIHLGMTPTEVQKLYGVPTTAETFNNGREKKWYYSSDKWRVLFNNGLVTAIRIYAGGTRHFDRSGFNCNNTNVDYAEKYMGVRKNYSRITVAKGEYIWISDEKDRYGYPIWVEISIFDN